MCVNGLAQKIIAHSMVRCISRQGSVVSQEETNKKISPDAARIERRGSNQNQMGR